MCKAGYTLQDNQADFGPNSPLRTKVSHGSKDYLARFSCGVRCVKRFNPLRSARKTMGAAPIRTLKYLTCLIFTMRSPVVWGEHQGQPSTHSEDVTWNDSQSGGKLTEDSSTTNKAKMMMINV